MAASFLVSFVVIFSLAYFGQATRFLPMIVWDHINPMFKCKCNWLTNIPKIDEYDRVDFMCPSPKVAVKLLDGYSRPTSEMNENIFRRKWEGNNLTDLGKALDNDSFCDPKNSGTTKLRDPCIDGEEGKSVGVTFKESNGYKTGDIFVFFNNGDDGKAATLSSQASKCSMVLVVNITWSAKVKHDISYGKYLNPNGDACDCTNITELLNCTCRVKPPLSTQCQPTSSSSPKPSTTTPKPSTTTSSPKPSTTTPKLSTTTSSPKPSTTTSSPKPSTTTSNILTGQGSSTTTEPCKIQFTITETKTECKHTTFAVGNETPQGAKRVSTDKQWNTTTFFIGFIAGIAPMISVVLVYFLYKRKKLYKRKTLEKPKSCICMQSVPPVQNSTAPGCICMQSVPPVQNSTSPAPGYPNNAFQTLTLPRQEVNETIDVGTTLDCSHGQRTGYSNEAFQSSTPTVEVKDPIGACGLL